MTGKHRKVKYKVKKTGDHWIVVIIGSDAQVPGTPTYTSKSDAEDHVNKLNK